MSCLMCFFAQTSPEPSSRKRNRASSADIDESIDLTKVSSVLGQYSYLFVFYGRHFMYVTVLFDLLFKGEPTPEESQGYRGRHN